MSLYMSRFANNALLGGGVRVRIREQRKNKRRSKALQAFDGNPGHLSVSALSSEFCTVQVLAELQICPLYRIARCRHSGEL